MEKGTDNNTRRPAAKWLLAAVVGALTGALTVFGKFLPPDWNALADSAALWMVAAYFAAAASVRPKTSVGLATLVLVVANTVYYPLSAIVNAKPIEFGSAMVVWYGGALAAGLVFGIAAYLWRCKTGPLYYLGAALPTAVLWAECAMMLTVEYYAERPAAPLCGFALGLALLLFCCVFSHFKWLPRQADAARGAKKTPLLLHCLFGLAAALPIAGLGIAGYHLLWWLLR